MDSIQKIEEFSAQFKTSDELFGSTVHFDAVLMNFVVIGEAVDKLPANFKNSISDIPWQKVKDFVTLPLRSLFIFEGRRWGLTSIKNERIEYAAREVRGYCLDVGCGKHNVLIKEFLGGNGAGIDVFAYDGLGPENIVSDMPPLPFPDGQFDSVTFIANLNHIPVSDRDAELAEAHRCLKSGGNIIVTMPCALAGILVHTFVHAYDRLFGTHYDVDAIRGMHHEEHFFVRDEEIIERLTRAGFRDIRKKYFGTQWGMNHLFMGWKR